MDNVKIQATHILPVARFKCSSANRLKEMTFAAPWLLSPVILIWCVRGHVRSASPAEVRLAEETLPTTRRKPTHPAARPGQKPVACRRLGLHQNHSSVSRNLTVTVAASQTSGFIRLCFSREPTRAPRVPAWPKPYSRYPCTNNSLSQAFNKLQAKISLSVDAAKLAARKLTHLPQLFRLKFLEGKPFYFGLT